jgi:hypothetical protein
MNRVPSGSHSQHVPPPVEGHKWLVNWENEATPLSQVAARLQELADALSDCGKVEIGDSLLEPSDPCVFVLRYEQMPRGELSLKIELRWGERNDLPSAPSGPPAIRKPSKST